jgi:O-antigen/teichoic acid export membrane protein
LSSASSGSARGYGRGARILSVGIATTGLVTFAYFSLVSHAFDGDERYKRISLLWSVMFVVVSVIYRPVEQLLSRTIAARRAAGLEQEHPLRIAGTIQAALALVVLVVALALHGTIEDGVFDGSSALYWLLVVGVLAYGASYFARGWLAGHGRFGLYGGLVFLESTSRCMFGVLAVLGVTHTEGAAAAGIAAAPFVSLVVVPLAFSRRASRATADGGEATPDGGRPTAGDAAHDLSLRAGSGFALGVLGIQLAEQTLLNAAVLTIDATSENAILAGVVFNVLLIARAPLQLFQAIQVSLLPHLAGLETTGGSSEFARAIRITVLAIAGFATAVAIGLLALGPFVMDVLFGGDFDYGRGGLALVALGMGFHLVAGTLNQAALARHRAGLAAAAWLACAALFVAWVASPLMDDELLRVEVGYLGAAALLSGLLFALYRRTGATRPGSGRE